MVKALSVRHLTAALWLVFLVIPAERWGLFHGRPIDAASALAIAGVCWLWWVRRSLPFGWLAVMAIVAKGAVAFFPVAPRGLEARYYANVNLAGAPEVGTETAPPGWSRVDDTLRFGGPGHPDLPVHFFNDNRRFNFYLPGEPQRETLPVSAVWEGWLNVTRTGLHRLFVRSESAHVTVSVGDDFSAAVEPSTLEWTAYPRLTSGLRRIRITLSIPQGGGRLFEAGWTNNGEEIPFGAPSVFRWPATAAARTADDVIHGATLAFDLVAIVLMLTAILGALARASWRLLTSQRTVDDALAVAWAAVIADGWLFARPLVDKMITLSGGDDWLSYETMARDIGLHGLWMTGGAALGHGHPYFYFPFYPYFVAATHRLFGDALYGLFLVQRVLIGGAAIALWRISARLFGERAGLAGFLAAAVLMYVKVAPWSATVLSELLFVPLVCFWALWIVRIATAPRATLWSAAGAGLLGGVATLTRSTLMLGWLLALPLAAIAVARARRAGRAAAMLVVLILVMMAVTSLATIRNWVVAHELVITSSSGPVNLIMGNEPPRPIVVPPAHRQTYDRLGIDPGVQGIIEYARQLPGPFFDGWRRKAAYSFGSFATLVPERGRSVFYMTFTATAFLGVLVLATRRRAYPAAGAASLIPLALALSHLAILIAIIPTVYGDRHLLAFYALMAPYAGLAIFAVAAGAIRIVKGKAPAAALGVLLAAVLIVPGCASPVAGDVRLAKASLANAVSLGASDYAPEALSEARRAQHTLDQELARLQGRWSASYDHARELAILAQQAADTAAAEAAHGREHAFANAQSDAGPSGGLNLFKNGAFAEGLQGWSVHPESDATVTVDAGPDERAWHVRYRKGNWSTIYQEFPLQPDTIYVYEATVKSTAPIVALYWQAETGRYFQIDKTYPEWTHLRYVFETPHWNGQPYRTGFNPVLMKGPGEAWLKALSLSEFKPRR